MEQKLLPDDCFEPDTSKDSSIISPKAQVNLTHVSHPGLLNMVYFVIHWLQEDKIPHMLTAQPKNRL